MASGFHEDVAAADLVPQIVLALRTRPSLPVRVVVSQREQIRRDGAGLLGKLVRSPDHEALLRDVAPPPHPGFGSRAA